MVKEYQVEYSPEAISNLQEIIAYYAAEYPIAMDEFMTALKTTVNRLKENPYMYAVPSNFPELAAMGYRKAPIYRRHLAFYRIQGQMIYIICIVASKQKVFISKLQ